MRKLRPTERRILEGIPEDESFGQITIIGQIRPYEIPLKKNQKNNRQTIINLYEMGLIRHGRISPYNCPIRLTEKGKKAIGREVIYSEKDGKETL